MTETDPLWKPDETQIDASRLTDFSRFVTQKTGQHFEDYEALHKWSCQDGGAFWDVLWDYSGVVGEKGDRIVADEGKMPGAAYFPDAELNYAENLLRYGGDDEAIVFRCEDKVQKRMSRNELQRLVSRLQQAFSQAGLQPGDRVAAMVPNMPETIAVMLAVTSLGGIWSSCSPDFGSKGVLDRFGQIEPKFFIACDGYWYGGKEFPLLEKMLEIVPGLDPKQTVLLSLTGGAEQLAAQLSNSISLEAFIAPFEAEPLQFNRVSFSHPLYILFSSGTTGVPKCIVHSHGGTLLNMYKEHQLHVGMWEKDRVYFFTTCGWMMWNWLVSALSSGATLMLYEGSPFSPGPDTIFDYAQAEKFTLFGTSAKYIDAVRNSGIRPIESHDLSSVRMVCSTGSPLAPENFEFVYSCIKSDVHLVSASGGTDIMGCFVMGVAWLPVYKGEIQRASLGMDVQVWDDEGNPMPEGKGELVCAHAFPSMPVYFWNDEDGKKYHSAYFDTFENVWCHGDFAEWTRNAGMVIHGRSDATLNPGGVRIGTAEIYNQVEQMPEVAEALCIGQNWNNDVRVVLFVKVAEGVDLTGDLIAAIKNKIRAGASPRHVPAKVVEVADIPRTKSGKITEIAVRDIVHGRGVKNREALANPEALDLFVDIKELLTD
ncbi:MAG: acetoacetate--CoA ligase [Pseudomonadota bacterium]